MRLIALTGLLALAACKNDPVDTDPDTTDADTTEADTDADTVEPDTDADTTPVTEAALIGPHDGTYVVGFQRGGDHFALGEFVVTQNHIEGQLRSGDGMDVTVQATAMSDESLRLDSLVASSSHTVQLLDGRIGGGFLEGHYSVDGDEGAFAGRRVGGVVYDRGVEYDGVYEVALVLGDDELTASIVHVSAGNLEGRFVEPTGVVTDVTGYVTTDGTVVLDETATSEGTKVLAEATIDQDSFRVEGIYRAGDVVGRVIGGRAD